MQRLNFALAAALLAATALSMTAARGQAPERIRGTITAFAGDTLSIKARDGSDVKIKLAPDATVGTVRTIALADIKPGTFIGTSAVKGPDGKLLAREVHILPPNTNPGPRPWDLEPGSTMTNANVASVMQGASGRELTLQYEGGMQTVVVPENVPVVQGVPADRSALVVGEYVVANVKAAADGTYTSVRVQVSKNGVRPPQ
jgi:hypothetical protein